MFEHRNQKLASQAEFRKRVLASLGVAGVLIACSLLLGVLGYRWLGGLGWVDALLNASMILGGVGPVDVLQTGAAKIFASFYALYSGIVLIATAGILLTAPLHRLMHKFHVETDDGESNDKPDKPDKTTVRKRGAK